VRKRTPLTDSDWAWPEMKHDVLSGGDVCPGLGQQSLRTIPEPPASEGRWPTGRPSTQNPLRAPGREQVRAVYHPEGVEISETNQVVELPVRGKQLKNAIRSATFRE
jgi:hypothetical protein